MLNVTGDSSIFARLRSIKEKHDWVVFRELLVNSKICICRRLVVTSSVPQPWEMWDDSGEACLGYWFRLHYPLVRICNSLEIILPRIPSGASVWVKGHPQWGTVVGFGNLRMRKGRAMHTVIMYEAASKWVSRESLTCAGTSVWELQQRIPRQPWCPM